MISLSDGEAGDGNRSTRQRLGTRDMPCHAEPVAARPPRSAGFGLRGASVRVIQRRQIGERASAADRTHCDIHMYEYT